MQGGVLSDVLPSALAAVTGDMTDMHPDWADYYRTAAPSIVMRWLGPMAGVLHSDERLSVANTFNHSQSFPAPDPARAPLGEPVRKFGGECQSIPIP